MVDRLENGPDGIDARHLDRRTSLRQHASPLSILLLGTLIVLALLGVLGGRPSPVMRSGNAAVNLSIKTPTTIRNGEFFETVIIVTPKRALAKLVIGVTPSLWRDLTQNSMVPAAGEESFGDGYFRFDYGPAEAGKPVEIKIDFQINPSLFGGTAGEIAIFDADQKLIGQAISMRVRP